MFSGITRCQERDSFVCKYRWTEEAKNESIHLCLWNFYKQLHSHCIVMPCLGKVKPLQSGVTFFIFNFLAINSTATVSLICTDNIVLNIYLESTRSIFRPWAIFPCTGPRNSYYCIIYFLYRGGRPGNFPFQFLCLHPKMLALYLSASFYPALISRDRYCIN